jgi:hypothetical protein
MTKLKITAQHILELQDNARKELKSISHPLIGMTRPLTESEELALSFFLASLSLLNRLTGEDISGKLQIEFDAVDSSSVYDV